MSIERNRRRRRALNIDTPNIAELYNTLDAPEEVIERRQHNQSRKRVAIKREKSHAKSILGENIIVLLALCASIYGIFRLCLTLLNQH